MELAKQNLNINNVAIIENERGYNQYDRVTNFFFFDKHDRVTNNWIENE